MGVLDWSFVALVSIAILFSFLMVISLFSFLRVNSKYKKNRKEIIKKNKKKRRKLLYIQKKIKEQKKKQGVMTISCFLLMILFVAGSYYTRNYQQNHLDGEDSQALLQSYFLLDDLSIQLENVKNDNNPQKSIKNINEITSRLASYGSRKSSSLLKEDGQRLLNRHYQLLRETGINLNAQTIESLQETAVNEAYSKDIEKVNKSQQTVFKRFNVNENALKKRK